MATGKGDAQSSKSKMGSDTEMGKIPCFNIREIAISKKEKEKAASIFIRNVLLNLLGVMPA
ncbi:hypothetical protein KEJ17_01465 [Candidatus Bathyarchaeota archaeon]|nr:hypothetical protein [Candidatus Bathyarchaeota archaeon]